MLLLETLHSSYGASVAAVVASTLLARLLGLGAEPGVFTPFMVAIVAIALAYGVGPGLVAITGSVVASYFWLLAPMLSLVPDPEGFRRVTFFRLGVFTAASLAILGIAEMHRRTLDRLHRSRRQLMAFMSDDSVGLQAVARDGRIVWADPTAIALLGYEPSDLVGSHLSRFVADANVARAIVQRIGNGEDVENVRALLRRHDGSTTEVLLNANTLLTDAHSGVLLAFLPLEPPAR